MGVALAGIGERSAYRIYMEKPEEKRSLGRPRHRWKVNNKMDIQELGFWGKNWINVAQVTDRWRKLVIFVMKLLVP
jgi:hypothetical protein